MSLWKFLILEIKFLSFFVGDLVFNIVCWDDWIFLFVSLLFVNYMYFVLYISIIYSGKYKVKMCGVGYVDFWLFFYEIRKFNKISYFVINLI